jgi:hypothetical protein
VDGLTLVEIDGEGPADAELGRIAEFMIAVNSESSPEIPAAGIEWARAKHRVLARQGDWIAGLASRSTSNSRPPAGPSQRPRRV